jgi:hypothetical protein
MKSPLFAAFSVLLVIGAVYAGDAPVIKDGLWSIHTVNTITSAGNAVPKTTEVTLSRCQDKGTPLQIPGNPPKKAECKVISKGSNGNTRFFDMQCTQKGLTTRVKETVTMKGENESHTITDSTFDPPMKGVSGMKLEADWKYLGACPAGVKPGDVVGPNGKVINPPKR